MALKYEIDSLDGVEESLRALYTKDGDIYRLDVDGVDKDAREGLDKVKEALRKEREERAEAKKQVSELQAEKERAEKEALEKREEFKKLYEKEQEGRTKDRADLDALKETIATKDRTEAANSIIGPLTKDTARAELLRREALPFVAHTPEGIKINGPDGAAWDAEHLSKHLAEKYPFLVDGNQSSGGGAAGSNGGGAVTKKFGELSGGELAEIRNKNPAEYDRLKSAHYGTS